MLMVPVVLEKCIYVLQGWLVVRRGSRVLTWPSEREHINKTIKIFFLIYFYYFWLCWVFVAACKLPLVAVSGSYSLTAVPRLFIMEASFVVEHRL